MWTNVISQPPFLLFRNPEKTDTDGNDDILIDTDLDLEQAKFKKRLFCSACKYPITFREAEVEVNGKSHYTFFNPHGLVFDLTCFSVADGCSAKGTPTSEFSWFPGFTWQVCACSRCRKHIGWMFSGKAGYFFALIMRELTE